MSQTPHTFSRRRSLQWLGVLATSPALGPFAQAAAPTLQAPPATLRIGFQKSSVNLVLLKQQGLLEKRFPNTRVQWVEFPAGPQLLEALAVDSLDLGFTGDAPPVFAQAAGKELFYVGAELPKPNSSAILVKQGSPIRTLADLKGKKIAFQKGSSAHYLVVRALEQGQVAWSDITPAYLTPSEGRAAFERDSVDAWAIWDPFYAAAEVDVKPRVLTNGVGLSGNNSFYLASRALKEQHPATILALFDELNRVDAHAQSHRIEAGKLIASQSGLNLSTVLRFLERRPATPTRPLWPALVQDQQRVADAFFKQGLIPRRIAVADIAWQPKS
jgi:sulfonate transport system substrate-binding protein